MSSVFGTGSVILRVMYPNTSNYVSIPLPAPNRRIPRIKPIVSILEGSAGQVVEKRVGYKISFVLEYELDLSETQGVTDFRLIKTAFNAQGELRLIPYADQRYQEFSVFLTDESELSGLSPTRSQYGICKLVFESKYLHQSWKDVDAWTMIRPGYSYLDHKNIIMYDTTRSSVTSPIIQII
jgi:hypothetical protein